MDDEKVEQSGPATVHCPVCGVLLVRGEFEIAGCGLCGAVSKLPYSPPVFTGPSSDPPAGFTAAVHSTLLEMIGLAASGRCMACGWPVRDSPVKGCVQGNCAFRPGEHTPEYQRWRRRTQILTLARKYLSGELAKPSDNAGDVQDAAAGEG